MNMRVTPTEHGHHIKAPMPPVREAQPSERDHAILVAKVILRAPNMDPDSDVAVLARQLLRALQIDY